MRGSTRDEAVVKVDLFAFVLCTYLLLCTSCEVWVCAYTSLEKVLKVSLKCHNFWGDALQPEEEDIMCERRKNIWSNGFLARGKTRNVFESSW